jgi:hypothetical protein
MRVPIPPTVMNTSEIDTDHIYSHADFRPIRRVGDPRRSRDMGEAAGLHDRIRAVRLRHAVLMALTSGPKSASEIGQYHMRGVGAGKDKGGTVRVAEIKSILQDMIDSGIAERHDVPSMSCTRGISTVYQLVKSATA